MKAIIAILMILLVGCQQKKENVTTFGGTAMTIEYKIIIGHPLTKESQIRIEKIIAGAFQEIDAVFNKWNPDSEISRINRLKANVPATISSELQNFLTFTQQIVELSEGRFDPTIEPAQKLWKNALEQGHTPSDKEVADVSDVIGWNKIHFAEGLFVKDHDQTSLDLGGIAKGYCVDLLVERLNDAGYSDVYVEWGGEIRANGQHPDQRPWTIFISRLGDTNPEHAVATLGLKDQAIATSGDYLQNWTIPHAKKNQDEGLITYFHIVDPKTARPLVADQKTIASVSVIAGNCALADGLATAAMLFPSVEEAQSWADKVKNKHPEIAFWLISRDNMSDP